MRCYGLPCYMTDFVSKKQFFLHISMHVRNLYSLRRWMECRAFTFFPLLHRWHAIGKVTGQGQLLKGQGQGQSDVVNREFE